MTDRNDWPASRPAGTLVLMRDRVDGPPHLLMLQRSPSMRFAANAMVFPGGAVDEGDRAIAAVAAPELDPDDAAGRIAAIRETLEETGLAIAMSPLPDAAALRVRLAAGEAFGDLLEEGGISLDLDQLVPFARWWPRNPGIPVFDTRFYITRAPDHGEAIADGTENVAALWISAADVLARAESGGPHVIFPTHRNLDRLAMFASHAEALAQAALHPVEPITPWREERDGVMHLCIPENMGYPVTSQPLEGIKRG